MKTKLVYQILILALLATPALATDAAPDRDNVTARDAAPLAASAVETSADGKAEPAEGGAEEASEGDTDSEDLGALTQKAGDLAKAGKWFALLGVSMLILVQVFRRFIFGKVAWFQTKAGGYAVSGGVALLTIIGLSLEVGFSMDVVVVGLSAGGLSMGMHTTSKDVKAARGG